MGYYSNKVLLVSSSKYMQSLLVPFILTYSLLLLIPFAFSDTDDMLGYYCPGPSYANGSSYSQSLRYLLEDLRVNTHKDYFKGFRNASWAQDNATVYGLALCRGDVSSSVCENCVRSAIKLDLNNHCPYKQEAVVVRRFCLFKYSDVEFRGEIDNKIYYHTDGTEYEYTPIGKTVEGFMENLSETAVRAPDKFFATGTTDAVRNKTLNGMVQCTRDLPASLCKECLDDITAYLFSWSMDTINVQAVTGSCGIHVFY